MRGRQGWEGWDRYAPFYDWENARTLGRRDVPFWTGVASGVSGALLELGCGTGRVSIPLARAGNRVIGIDRSTPMLARAAKRARVYRAGRKPSRGSLSFVRGDIRALPFSDRAFAMVLAPYGILQSLLRDRDLAATLRSAARVLEPGGIFGIDLVPDVPHWREYQNRIRMRGRAAGGVHLTLIESVRQDPDRHLTIFEQCYVERRGRERTEHRFDLTFRTLPVKSMVGRLERAGFEIEAILGDYQGTPWDERADTWVVLSRIKG